MENKNLKFCQRCENTYINYIDHFNYWLCNYCFHILNNEHNKKVQEDLFYRIATYESYFTSEHKIYECETLENFPRASEFLESLKLK